MRRLQLKVCFKVRSVVDWAWDTNTFTCFANGCKPKTIDKLESKQDNTCCFPIIFAPLQQSTWCTILRALQQSILQLGSKTQISTKLLKSATLSQCATVAHLNSLTFNFTLLSKQNWVIIVTNEIIFGNSSYVSNAVSSISSLLKLNIIPSTGRFVVFVADI